MRTHEFRDEQLFPDQDDYSGLKLDDVYPIYRCPKCLTQMEQFDQFIYDCHKCSLRVKIWKYYPGIK